MAACHQRPFKKIQQIKLMNSKKNKGNTIPATAEGENLNIYYNIKLLAIKALNSYPTHAKAAAALGVSEKTLFNYKKIYRIEKDVVTGKYEQKVILSNSFKKELVKQLSRVSDRTILGLAIADFVKTVQAKSDEDFIKVLTTIKEQSQDCPEVMESILGKTFPYFQMINA